MIRSFQLSDLAEIQKIHEKYYAEEFPFPDFISKFLCAFTVVSDGQIVSAGGIRTIPECIIITDKSKSVKVKRQALYEMLYASAFVTGRFGYDELVATVINNPNWKRHLNKVGFKPVKGDMLVLPL